MQGGKRFTAKQEVPKIRSENIEKTKWRKNRAGQSFLKLDVMFYDFGIRKNSNPAQVSDVASIKALIDAQTFHFRLGMNGLEETKRTGWLRKKIVGQSQKDPGDKDDQNS